LMGESLKTLAESAKPRFCRLHDVLLPAFCLSATSAMGCGKYGSENKNPDAPSIMPCDRARRRRGHANAFAQAEGHA
jgi:hypothetical protein